MTLPAHRSRQGSLRRPRMMVDSPSSSPLDGVTLALYAVIATYVWRWQDLFPAFGKLRPAILALGFALLLFALDRDPRRRFTSSWTPIPKAALGILALTILSVPGSLWQGRSFYFIIDDFSKNVVILFILAASTRAVTDTRRFIGMIVVGGIVYAAYVNLKVSIGQSGRLGSLVYYDANDLGMLVVATFPLALFFALRARSVLIKLGAGLALALFVVTIIKTGSRGAFLGLVAIGIYVLTSWRSLRRNHRYGVIVAAVVAMLVFGGDTYWQMMGTLLHPQDDYNWSGQAESGRMEVWRRGIGYMISHPILGVGARCFPVAEGELSPLAARQEYGIGLKWSAAHNSYVQVGAELGVLGLILLLQLVFKSFRAAREPVAQYRGDSPPTRLASDVEVLGDALGGSVVGFAVTAFFLSQGYAAFFMILCGTIAGFEKAVRSSDGRRPSVASQHRSFPSRPRPVRMPAGRVRR